MVINSNDDALCKCGSSGFYFKGSRKVCSSCGEVIGIIVTKKKCKVVGCKKVSYKEGYCRNHYDVIEADRYREAKLEAKERAEAKGEEFSEGKFLNEYNSRKNKNIKPENVDKLNKKLF